MPVTIGDLTAAISDLRNEVTGLTQTSCAEVDIAMRRLNDMALVEIKQQSAIALQFRKRA